MTAIAPLLALKISAKNTNAYLASCGTGQKSAAKMIGLPYSTLRLALGNDTASHSGSGYLHTRIPQSKTIERLAFDLAPNFYPALSSLRRLNMPCWVCDAMASPS